MNNVNVNDLHPGEEFINDYYKFYPPLTDRQLESYVTEKELAEIKKAYESLISKRVGRILQTQKELYLDPQKRYEGDTDHVERLIEESAQECFEIAQIQVRLEKAAQTDSLTGLLRPEALAARYEIAKNRLTTSQNDPEKAEEITFAFVDLDRIKLFNDLYGHPFVDKILKKVGEKTNSMLRATDAACRYGGDELVLLLSHTTPENVQKAIERYYRALSSICVIENPNETDASLKLQVIDLSVDTVPEGYVIKERVSMSIGLLSLDKNEPLFLEELTKIADLGAYKSKRRGERGAYTCIEPAADSEEVKFISTTYKYDVENNTFNLMGEMRENLEMTKTFDLEEVRREVAENLKRTLNCVNVAGHSKLPPKIEAAIDSLAKEIHGVCYT